MRTWTVTVTVTRTECDGLRLGVGRNQALEFKFVPRLPVQTYCQTVTADSSTLWHFNRRGKLVLQP
eukprot:1109698-Rhodomonas_salina.1